jgi:uncharacterized membrane protein
VSADHAIAAVFALAAVLGVRSTFRLLRIVRPADHDRRTILNLLTLIAGTITLAALYFGVMSVRRLLGFEAFPWAPTVSVLLSATVLLIPVGIDLVVERIQARPDERGRRSGD